MEINDSLVKWIATGDRGISSEAIVAKLTGLRLSNWGLWPPSDPADFKRCVALLYAVPEFKLRLNEMKEVSPQWSRLVDNWDELERLYLEECGTGRCPKLYKRMEELRKEKED